MNISVRSSTLTAVLVFGLAVPVAAQQFLSLQPKFAPGEEAVFRRNLTFRQVMRRPTVSQGNTTLTDTTEGYRLRVLDGQRPDHHPLEITFLTLTHRFGRPIGMEFDSRTDWKQDDLQSRVVGAILERPFQVVVRDDGSVASVTGVEEFLKDDFGTQPNERARAVVNHYHGLVSPKNLENLLLLNLRRDLPPEVLLGGKWSSRFESSIAGGAGHMLRDMDFVLDEVKLVRSRPLATISVDGKISLAKSPDTQPANATRIHVMTGQEQGSIVIDVVSRRYQRIELTQNVRMELRRRSPSERMGVRRIAEQVTKLTLERTTLADLMPPPPRKEQPPASPAAQPVATQPVAAQEGPSS